MASAIDAVVFRVVRTVHAEQEECEDEDDEKQENRKDQRHRFDGALDDRVAITLTVEAFDVHAVGWPALHCACDCSDMADWSCNWRVGCSAWKYSGWRLVWNHSRMRISDRCLLRGVGIG